MRLQQLALVSVALLVWALPCDAFRVRGLPLRASLRAEPTAEAPADSHPVASGLVDDGALPSSLSPAPPSTRRCPQGGLLECQTETDAETAAASSDADGPGDNEEGLAQNDNDPLLDPSLLAGGASDDGEESGASETRECDLKRQPSQPLKKNARGEFVIDGGTFDLHTHGQKFVPKINAQVDISLCSKGENTDNDGEIAYPHQHVVVDLGAAAGINKNLVVNIGFPKSDASLSEPS